METDIFFMPNLVLILFTLKEYTLPYKVEPPYVGNVPYSFFNDPNEFEDFFPNQTSVQHCGRR